MGTSGIRMPERFPENPGSTPFSSTWGDLAGVIGMLEYLFLKYVFYDSLFIFGAKQVESLKSCQDPGRPLRHD
jgi:hypothetical protein